MDKINIISGLFWNKLEYYYKEAKHSLEKNTEEAVLVLEGDELKYFGKALAALDLRTPLFLGSSEWKKGEMEDFRSQVGDVSEFELEAFRGHIMIPTGGSSGKLKFAMHTWETLEASVKGTLNFLGVKHYKCFNILPLQHVSGFMPCFRALLSGGECIFGDYNEWKKGIFPTVPEGFYLSLVPTQLGELMGARGGIEFLRRFKGIFLGGSGCRKELLKEARAKEIPLILTYGMTETGSMVSALPKEAFLKGEEHSGYTLDHCEISQVGENSIKIIGKSLFLGYFPEKPQVFNEFIPQDRVELGSKGELIILGRADDVIISGGEKICPSEVEAAVLGTGLVKEAHIIGVESETWGQAVGCIYTGEIEIADWEWKEVLKEVLVGYKIPKVWARVDGIPRNSVGKIDKKEVLKYLMTNKI